MKKSIDLRNTYNGIKLENLILNLCLDVENFLELPLLSLLHPMPSIISRILFPYHRNLLVIFVPSTDQLGNLKSMELKLI